jgi:hypothetical protein
MGGDPPLEALCYTGDIKNGALFCIYWCKMVAPFLISLVCLCYSDIVPTLQDADIVYKILDLLLILHLANQ